MGIKVLGAVLVLTSATAIGYLLAYQVKEQERWLTDIKLSFLLLSGELEYHQLPLPEAFLLTGTKHGGRMKEFFLQMGEELAQKAGGNFQEIWRKQAEKTLKSAPIKKEQKEEFEQMGVYFTGAEQSVRTHAIEFYTGRLETEIEKLRETGKEKAYLYRMLGMLGGIFLLILAA